MVLKINKRPDGPILLLFNKSWTQKQGMWTNKSWAYRLCNKKIVFYS